MHLHSSVPLVILQHIPNANLESLIFERLHKWNPFRTKNTGYGTRTWQIIVCQSISEPTHTTALGLHFRVFCKQISFFIRQCFAYHFKSSNCFRQVAAGRAFIDEPIANIFGLFNTTHQQARTYPVNQTNGSFAITIPWYSRLLATPETYNTCTLFLWEPVFSLQVYMMISWAFLSVTDRNGTVAHTTKKNKNWHLFQCSPKAAKISCNTDFSAIRWSFWIKWKKFFFFV